MEVRTQFHYFGAMPFLLGRLIEESKASAAEEIDFGRSDWQNKSLTAFKDKFGHKEVVGALSLFDRKRGTNTHQMEFARDPPVVRQHARRRSFHSR
jgi:hypothetical protein